VTVNTYSLQSFFILKLQLLLILKTDMAQKGKIFTLQKNVHSPVAHNILNLISSRKTETFILVPTLRFSIVYVS